LLALDLLGNAVIIELKKGKPKDPVDMQGLRYASYISKWKFDDFESRAPYILTLKVKANLILMRYMKTSFRKLELMKFPI